MANYNSYNNGNQRSELDFKLVEELGVLDVHKSGWSREVNLVAWNGKPPKFDIRDWDPEHVRMSRGITLHENEAIKLVKILVKRLQMNEAQTQAFETRYQGGASRPQVSGPVQHYHDPAPRYGESGMQCQEPQTEYRESQSELYSDSDQPDGQQAEASGAELPDSDSVIMEESLDDMEAAEGGDAPF